MEELNNRQLTLLTMFVSFVVSIATGIITVALLQEAPPTLTQTVNRVVEHTIERVITGSTTEVTTKSPTLVTNLTKEVTVYAREEDLVVSAVSKNQSRVAKIYTSGHATSSSPVAIGFVVSRDGIIVTDTRDLLGENQPESSYSVIVADKQYSATPIALQSGDEPTYFLKLSSLSTTTAIDAVSYGRDELPKLAQTAIVLGGTEGDNVFKTSISKLRFGKLTASSSSQVLSAVETLPVIPAHNSGALVVNLDGQALGLVVGDSSDIARYVVYPIGNILKYLNVLSAKKSGTN